MTSQLESPEDTQRATPVAQSRIRKLTTDKAVKAYRGCVQTTTTAGGVASEDVSNIKLSDRGIKSIESLELPFLRRLDLSKNNLNRLKGLQGCPQVTYLTVAGNELTGEGLDGVRPLRDLTVFNASGNRIKRVPPSVFAQFRALQALVLNNNSIAEVPPTWFKKGLLSLNTLVMSHNQVKSLTDTGLGRLTALTKLSVSHNLLQVLPDLSPCSALSELRASHNQVSEVPASLAANVALRTLDLGHNSIQEWRGLERLGKALTSLVQLSLSGNPLCTSSNTTVVDVATEDGEEEGSGGTYVKKIKSIFPGLKVRDGRRVMMKKSHTYHELKTGGAAGAGGSGDDGGGDARSRGVKQRGEDPARSSKAVKKKSKKRSSRPGLDDEGASGDKGRQTQKSEDGVTSERDGQVVVDRTSDEKNQHHEKAKKTRTKKTGAAGVQENVAELCDKRFTSEEPKPKGKKRRRDGHKNNDNDDVSRPAAKRGEGTAAAAVASSTVTGPPPGGRGNGVTASIREDKQRKTSKDEKKKKKKTDVAIVDPPAPTSSSGDTTMDNDPYSSSEELPTKKNREHKQKSPANGAPPHGAVDLESGVVTVTVNQKISRHKKKRGTKNRHSGTGTNAVRKHCQSGGGDGGGDGDGDGDQVASSSIEHMLKARQTMTLGVGSGMSAWD